MTGKKVSLSGRPKVLATYPLPGQVEDRLRSFAELRILDGETDPERIVACAEGHDVLICTLMNKISSAFAARLPASIRLIATYSVGYDHVDLSALRERGVRLIHTPDVLTDATADIAWLLLLGAARRAHEAQRLLRDGLWKGWEPCQMVGSDIRGKTLGVLGFGRIGRAVTRRAMGFEMGVLTFSRDPAGLGQLPGNVVVAASMEEVLRESDFLSLHLPLTQQTQNWLNAERIATMKPAAILINTARGGLVDTAALAAALRSGHLGGAGLDVFRDEPNIERELLEAPNTYLLPHIGSATTSARDKMGLSLAADIAAFAAAQPLSCEVA